MNSLETHNQLDASIGLIFTECSIIAADACRLATERAPHEMRSRAETLIMPHPSDHFLAVAEKTYTTILGKLKDASGAEVVFALERQNSSSLPRRRNPSRNS